MARGRFISNSLSQSRKFAALASDTNRMLYLMLVTHADREGRCLADPILVAGTVITRLENPLDEIQAALEDIDRVGLGQLYEVDGEQFLEITGFAEHNVPHKREAESKIPPPKAGQRPTRGTPKADPGPDQGTPKADPGSNSVQDARPTLGQPKVDLRSPEVEVEVEVEVKEPPPTPPTLARLVERLSEGEGEKIIEARKTSITEHATRRGEQHVETALLMVIDKLAAGEIRSSAWGLFSHLVRQADLTATPPPPRRTTGAGAFPGGDRQNRNHPDWRPVRGQTLDLDPPKAERDDTLAARATEAAANDRRNTLAQQASELLAAGRELN